MVMNKKLRGVALATSPLLATALLAANLRAVEPEGAGSRVEDDAWYDVSEWFDGNDYNPRDDRVVLIADVRTL